MCAAAAWVGLATAPDEWAVAALRMKDSRCLQGCKQENEHRGLLPLQSRACAVRADRPGFCTTAGQTQCTVDKMPHLQAGSVVA